MKALYLECKSGISGDMTAAALLDLGADRSALERMLSTLPLKGFSVRISRVSKAGLDMCDFDVVLHKDNHDHDMDYLYGHEYHHDHAHEHEHDHEHEHEHHHHTSLTEILHILSHADMTEGAQALAEKIFRILAAAESKAHGVSEEKVHFHEVGAVDSIVDIASVAVLLDSLGVEQVIVPELCEGMGTVRCQHGVLPVPVPAVTNIVQAHALPLTITQRQGELVTPTGAAIVAAVRTGGTLPKLFQVKKIGMGAGKRAYERPSFLRAMLVEWDEKPNEDTIVKLETNVDDSTGEALGYVMERLLEEGARDVFYTPVYMKKQRPGVLLTVLCDEERREALEEILFRETTTIGVRRTVMERTVLRRRLETVETTLGSVQVKRVAAPEGERCYPEYESVAALCRATGLSWQRVVKQLSSEL